MKDRTAQLKQYCNEHDLTYMNERTSVLGYGHSEASKVTAAYKKILKEEQEVLDKLSKNGIMKSDKQFGKKVGKHASDYGLDPSSAEDRQKMEAIIDDIFNNRTEPIRIGNWRGQKEEVLFHIKDSDVVITKQDGEFVTVLRGGVTNGRVKDARKFKI